MKRRFLFGLYVIHGHWGNEYLIPLPVVDDGAYAFIKEPMGHEYDETHPIESLADIVESMINHWNTHNDRVESVAKRHALTYYIILHKTSEKVWV